MAHRTTVQTKTISSLKLLHHPQILPTKQTLLVKIENEYSSLFPIHAGIPQGIVLGFLLYFLFTADRSTSPETSTATFTDDTAVLASDTNPAIATSKLQTHLLAIQNWLTKWRVKVNESKSMHVTFTIQRETCPPVYINEAQLPQAEDVKYLGLHLDRRFTSHNHIFMEQKTPGYNPYKNPLVTQMEIETVHTEQTTPLQSNTQTHLELQYSTLGNHLIIIQRNT
jgi:hypothetical protein